MNLQIFLGRLFTILVFTAIVYLLTKNIAVGSVMGIILAVIALGATILFMHLLPKLYQPEEEENQED